MGIKYVNEWAIIVVGDVIADSVEDYEEVEEEKGGIKVNTIKTEEEAKTFALSDIAMPVLGSRILYPSIIP